MGNAIKEGFTDHDQQPIRILKGEEAQKVKDAAKAKMFKERAVSSLILLKCLTLGSKKPNSIAIVIRIIIIITCKLSPDPR